MHKILHGPRTACHAESPITKAFKLAADTHHYLNRAVEDTYQARPSVMGRGRMVFVMLNRCPARDVNKVSYRSLGRLVHGHKSCLGEGAPPFSQLRSSFPLTRPQAPLARLARLLGYHGTRLALSELQDISSILYSSSSRTRFLLHFNIRGSEFRSVSFSSTLSQELPLGFTHFLSSL